MILAKPTEKLTGVTAEGSFDDFYELTDSISGGCFCGFVCPWAFLWSRRNYGQRAKKPENTIAFRPLKYADYIRDTVVIDTLLAAILGALAEAIGDDEFEELCRIKENQYSDFF